MKKTGDNFDSSMGKPFPEDYFRGVSLRAMTELSNSKGYRLIGGHRHGFNVLFMRNDVGAGVFPEVSVESVHDNPATRRAQKSWPQVQKLPWERV